MFTQQLRLLLRRKEFLFVLGGMLLLALAVFAVQCFQLFGADTTNYLSADKLFIGRADSSDFYIFIPYLLPLMLALPFADSYITDKQHNILPLMLTRAKHRDYFLSKLSVAALAGGLVIFVPFLINFLLGLAAFPPESVNYSLYGMSSDQSYYYASYMDQILFPTLFAASPYAHEIS